jgi:hypothetical protein
MAKTNTSESMRSIASLRNDGQLFDLRTGDYQNEKDHAAECEHGARKIRL